MLNENVFIQHEFIEYWFVLIMHPDRRQSIHFACLVLLYNQQCVQSSLLEFVFLISKLYYHPLNEMVIKPFVLHTLLTIDFSRTVISF